MFTSSFSGEVTALIFLPCCPSHACWAMWPSGLVLCLENAVTVVDLCDVTLVVKLARDQHASVIGSKSPRICVSWSEGAGLIRPLDNLTRSLLAGVSAAMGLTAREENLEFMSRRQRRWVASRPHLFLSPGPPRSSSKTASN